VCNLILGSSSRVELVVLLHFRRSQTLFQNNSSQRCGSRCVLNLTLLSKKSTEVIAIELRVSRNSRSSNGSVKCSPFKTLACLILFCLQYLHWCEMERRHQEGIAASAVEALCLQKPFKESSGIKALRRAVKVLCQVKEPSKATDKEAEMRLLLEREREAYVKRMERQSMDEKARRFAAWANLQEQKTQQFSQELDAALRRHGAAVRAARALQDVHLLNTRMRFLSVCFLNRTAEYYTCNMVQLVLLGGYSYYISCSRF
jgi:hypothetical protein